jgi:hypothetical protein
MDGKWATSRDHRLQGIHVLAPPSGPAPHTTPHTPNMVNSVKGPDKAVHSSTAHLRQVLMRFVDQLPHFPEIAGLRSAPYKQPWYETLQYHTLKTKYSTPSRLKATHILPKLRRIWDDATAFLHRKSTATMLIEYLKRLTACKGAHVLPQGVLGSFGCLRVHQILRLRCVHARAQS